MMTGRKRQSRGPRTDDKMEQPRPLRELQADVERAARRCDNAVLLLAVMAAAGLAWMTPLGQRASLAEGWRQAALQQRLCQAYVAVAPGKSYADFPVCVDGGQNPRKFGA